MVYRQPPAVSEESPFNLGIRLTPGLMLDQIRRIPLSTPSNERAKPTPETTERGNCYCRCRTIQRDHAITGHPDGTTIERHQFVL